MSSGGPSLAKDAEAYQRDWALKTGRPASEIYVPKALREQNLSTAQHDVVDYHGRHRVIEGEPVEVTGQMPLPFPEETVKQESGRRHEFVTGFALGKTHLGDWVFIGNITDVLDIERPPSDDEVRHGATEAAEFLRMKRLVNMIVGPPQPVPPHSH